VARHTRLIRVAPDRAFAYLSDLTRHREWAINSLDVQQVTEGPVRVGSRFRSLGRQFGQAVEDEVVITAFEPNQRFEFESSGRGGAFRHAFLFEGAEGGTRLTKVMEAKQLRFPFSLTRPIADLFLGRRMAKDLQRIAARLEDGSEG
jgi:uncharacterized protein YndB with AHSA1/START domain